MNLKIFLILIFFFIIKNNQSLAIEEFKIILKVENEIINSDLINQAVVYGDNKPYLSAILVLDNQKNISQVKLKKEIDKINNDLTNIEKIKKYILAKEIFSIENGLLTPSLKLKRHKIIEKYKKELESLY